MSALENALRKAAFDGNAADVRRAIAQGAEIEARRFGRSALHYAVSNEQLECVGILLDAGAEVDGPTDDGTTPLMFAASRGNLPILRLLLECGADPNRGYPEEWTALECAEEKGHDDVIDELTRLKFEQARPKTESLLPEPQTGRPGPD